MTLNPSSTSTKILLFLLLVTVSLGPRIFALDYFVTPDEPSWLTRSAKFYTALKDRAYVRTYQREHPGVTVMWAGTMGILTRFPTYEGTGSGKDINPTNIEDHLKRLAIQPIDFLAAGRMFIVLMNSIILATGFLFVMRLVGWLPALFGMLLIAFDPFVVGLNRLLHLDGVLASCMFLAFIAYMSYFHTRRFFDLIVSGIAAGLGWLTKTPGFFLAPIVVIVHLLFVWRHREIDKEYPVVSRVWGWVKPLVIWGGVGAMTFVILWPSMWVNPVGTLWTMFAESVLYATGGHDIPLFFNGEIFQSGRIGSRFWFFYPFTYLWRTTPWVWIGLITAFLGYALKLKPFDQSKVRQMTVGFVIFVLVYAVLMNMGTKKFDRYLLPVYLPLNLLVGFGWLTIGYWLRSAGEASFSRFWIPMVLSGVVIAQAAVSISVFPYYLSYYNPVMGGGKAAHRVMMVGWGEGLDQAARYLNQKPNADQFEVASWYSPGSFSYFFQGDSRVIPAIRGLKRERLPELWQKDYAIIYVNQWQRQIPPQYLDFVAQKTLEHTIKINGIEYVRIYRLKD